MEPRLSRYQHFEEFFGKAKSVFDDYNKNDVRSHEFSRLYSFYAVPGGRSGGRDQSLIQIFFGQRPVKKIEEIVTDKNSPLPFSRSRFLTESGACLQYQCEESGYVTCFLFPAVTESMRREEGAILLDVIKDPSTLLKGRTKRHWDSFISYMQVTSLDGEPNLIDRMRVFYILYTKTLSVKEKETSPRIWTHLGCVIKFSLTVGLSGFLLTMVSFFDGPKKVFIAEQPAKLYEQAAVISKQLSDVKAMISLINQKIVSLDGHFDSPISVKVTELPEKPEGKDIRRGQQSALPATDAKNKKSQ